MSNRRKAKSPYQRYGKAPYRYSEIYQKWRQAVKSGRSSEARHWAQEHAIACGITNQPRWQVRRETARIHRFGEVDQP